MTEQQKKIYAAYDKLPLPAIMQGSKASIAGDVSAILGETVEYEEITAAIETFDNSK